MKTSFELPSQFEVFSLRLPDSNLEVFFSLITAYDTGSDAAVNHPFRTAEGLNRAPSGNESVAIGCDDRLACRRKHTDLTSIEPPFPFVDFEDLAQGLVPPLIRHKSLLRLANELAEAFEFQVDATRLRPECVPNALEDNVRWQHPQFYPLLAAVDFEKQCLLLVVERVNACRFDGRLVALAGRGHRPWAGLDQGRTIFTRRPSVSFNFGLQVLAIALVVGARLL